MSEQTPRTTGTATSRARAVRPAVRRPTLARLAMSGPSGSGKTWTALSVAEVLAPGGRILVIDTERGDDQQGAAELYADQFQFEVLEWDPPYNPRDLALTLDELSARPDAERPAVVIIDSASHFWVGQGGTLDIVDGKYANWKIGTPIQDEMVNAFLRCGFHLIVCTRARQDYVVDQDQRGKQVVTKLGLAPVQRDAMEYEFQVVLSLDMEHRLDVGKTRAQPLAGQSWPAGQQARFAASYRDWLRSGVRLARGEDVEALREVLRTADLGRQWQTEGWPKAGQLGADRLVDAWAWVGQQLGITPHPVGNLLQDGTCERCGTSPRARWHTDQPADPAELAALPGPHVFVEQPPAADPVEESVQPEPEPEGEAPATPDRRAEAQAHVAATLAPAAP